MQEMQEMQEILNININIHDHCSYSHIYESIFLHQFDNIKTTDEIQWYDVPDDIIEKKLSSFGKF